MSIVILSAFAVIIVLWGITETEGERSSVEIHYAKHAHDEIGTINVVSAIYLGYRLFDTLGEAIVLFLTAIGTQYLLGERP